MTFEEILDQAIALLQRRGRLTYGALKRQFNLDDAYLEDLKTELIEGQRLAVDEEGRVLVWTGRAAVPSFTTPPAPQLGPPPTTADVQPLQVLPPPAVPQSPDAERRQLTVLFCDLVDSTTLSSQLDPEEYRDVVRAYQTACTEVVQRYDGHVAQLLGDGLLVYFGYPQAHEDDAHRAIHTGLGIIEAIGTLNIRLEYDQGLRLAVRLGMHTGLVVVGEIGGGGRQEQLALGEVPNVTSRIQGLAEPNTIVISAATYRLVQGYFECQAFGAQVLRGVSHPVAVYRVLQASGAQSRLDIASTRGLTPLVGRESEVALLLERWEQVKNGQGQVVLLTGDAGIGKSRLVQMLKEHIATEPHLRWECRSAEYSQNTALFPLTDLFQRILQFEASETPDAKLAKLEHALSHYRLPLEESVPLFAPLLSLPLPENHYPPLNLSPQRQRQKTLETIVDILLELAEHHLVLFILEDLHWTDPSTLELISLLLDQTPTASLLVLLTCRPYFQPAWHHRSYLTEITVNRLSHAQVEQIVTDMTDGKTFPAEVLQQILEKTDGVPLFVEEMTKSLLESEQLKALDGRYELVGSFSTFAIPATLQDSLMARLDRLVTAKAVAQYTAVIGRQFSYDLLHVVSQLDDVTLRRELSRLVEAEIVYQRGLPPQASYHFKHALIRDAAYESLLKSTRQHYHQRIAQVLESQFPETVEGQPELLAHHYTEAGLTEKAVHYWYQAGQSAVQRSAHVEAISHLTKGLELLKMQPETPERTQREVGMHIALGASLIATKGYAAPEVGETYTSAQQLCQHLEDPYELCPVLRGLWSYYLVRAELQTAHALGEQLLALAQQVQDAAMLLGAHRALGATLFFLGETTLAHTHLAQGLALYDPQQHRAQAFLYGEDTGVVCRSHAALALWHLGYPDQGLARNDEAVTLAQHLVHPYSLCYVLSCAALCHQLRREERLTQERAEALISLAKEQGFPYQMAMGSILRGWALAQQGQAKEGIEQLNQGLMDYRATGAEALRPYYLALLAEAHGTMGQPESGLTVLAEALTLADTTGERWSEAELHCLKGELILLQQNADHQAEAEACFHHALEIAHNQQAKSFELRAATSLARLWQQQGQRQEARTLLTPVYDWFTEGLDTADLQDAKALLEALA
jgi:class 3 adenylate cyclase/predicted ATPase/energy-coupling factor transporter ATP-binding protein EcfA2